MNYEDFSEETKKYIDKTIEVYSAIEDKKIDIFIDDPSTDYIRSNKKIKYTINKFDKKVISLFIAGFLAEGNLAKIYKQYDDIVLDDLLDFVSLDESDIVPLKGESYKEYYKKNIQLDLMSIINNNSFGIEINFITPELIVSMMRYYYTTGSEILEYYAEQYNISLNSNPFSSHNLFKALDSYTELDGSISEKSSSDIGIKNIDYNPTNFTGEFKKEKIDMEPKKTESDFELNKDVWHFLDEIKIKFVGQEVVVEDLFYNIVNNQQLSKIDDIPDGERSIIFLDGPTGTGKTAITRDITEKLGLPFVSTSATNYSSVGYVGGDITDILRELYKKSNNNLKKAERGIVVLDEFDKIASADNNGLVMRKAVQQQLLDFMGGGKYSVMTGNSLLDMGEVEFDTSKLTFICLGALTDLRSKKTSKKQPIGFAQTYQSQEGLDYTITPEDLIDIGLERELVGRFNTYLHTKEYSREDLKNILKDSPISPLQGFITWVESRGKKIDINEDIYDLIVNAAYELNTGARSLQTIMNSIRTHYIKEVLRSNSDTIYLDSETVSKAINNITNRKGRI